jgi:hypothetical protein
MQCSFIHPYAYSILILLFTIITADVFILLLLWGPRLTTRDSRYAYSPRSQEDHHEST